jgi:hypothetical protein
MDSSVVLVKSMVIFVPPSNYIIDCFLLLNVLKDTMEGVEYMDKAA